MGLVDNYETYVPSAQVGMKFLAGKLFRRDIENLDFAEIEPVLGKAALGPRHTRVEACGTYTGLTQVIDLILHQGYERSDNQCESVEEHRRHLECY